jgi:hypothetical protein
MFTKSALAFRRLHGLPMHIPHAARLLLAPRRATRTKNLKPTLQRTDTMTTRITEKQLQAVVDRLNRITGSPLEPYAKVDGAYAAQVGNYHLSHAYGGVCLHRMHNESGGVSSPLSTGHVSKRELLGLLHAYINGIESQVTA